MNLTFADDKQFIIKLTELTLESLGDENFGAKELVNKTGMNHSTIHRRLKAISNKTISQFICEIRLQKALELLQQDSMTVSEVAYRVGFGSPTYFNKCFHEHFGYPPGEYIKRGLTTSEEDNITISDVAGTIPESLSTKRRRKQQIIMASSGILILIIVTFLIDILSTKVNHSKNQEKSIAVLPFKNLSEDVGNQYFADGIMEEILNRLFLIKELTVISRTSVEQFRESKKTAPEIASLLGVNFILEGSVQKFGSKVRIIVQLIDAKNDQHILSEKFDSEFSDIFNLQSKIAMQIGDKLQASLSLDEIEKINQKPTLNTEAYNYYLLANVYGNKETEDEFNKSKDYFEKALALDPDFALAFVGLAGLYLNRTFFGLYPQEEGYAKAKEYVLRALELNPDLADAHSTLADLYCWSEWKWEESLKEYRHSIKLNPRNASVHASYSNLLDILGQNDEARAEINIALKLDPLSYSNNYLSAMYYYHEKKFEESLVGFQLAKDIYPADLWAYWSCLLIYFWKSDGPSVVGELQKILSMSINTIKNIDNVKRIYDQSGNIGILNWLIKLELQKTNPSPIMLAIFNFYLGNKEEELLYLEKAVNERSPWIPRMNNNPEIEWLRNEPRYIEMIKKLGLYEYYKANEAKRLNH